MLTINPVTLTAIAEDNGWLHESGRLKGTINTRKMAAGLDVATTTIARAYDGGGVGIVLLDRLRRISGRSLDDIVTDATSDTTRQTAEALAS